MNDLEQLQTDIETYLMSCEADLTNADETPIQFAMIARVRPRSAEEAAGIQTKLQQALSGLQGRNGKKGISIIVGMTEISKMETNIRALTGTVTINLEVTENIMVNMGAGGCGPHGCESFAQAAAELLSHQPFNRWSPMRVVSVLPSPEAVLSQKVVYNVTLQTDLKRALKPKVGAVTIATPENGFVTITCPTEDAVIYYTLDGSYPGSGSESAIVYDTTAGLNLPVGVHRVRAAAWLVGQVGSVPDEETVTVV
jgi:hypothetical protein